MQKQYLALARRCCHPNALNSQHVTYCFRTARKKFFVDFAVLKVGRAGENICRERAEDASDEVLWRGLEVRRDPQEPLRVRGSRQQKRPAESG